MARARYRYDKRTGAVYEVTADSEERRQHNGAYVISDTMDGIVHPANGKRYDSKSRFRDETRARGCVEVGNDMQRDTVDRSITGVGEELSRVYDQMTQRC